MTDLPDEETIPVRRTRSGKPAPEAADPGLATEAAGDTEPVRRRSTYIEGTGAEQTDGSTFVARRESRRRAARSQSAPPPADPAPSPVPQGRVAASPDAASDVYGARSVEPVVVPRAAPPQRIAQVPVDGTAAAAAHRRTARRTALIVVMAASAIALAAAGSLIALTLNL